MALPSSGSTDERMPGGSERDVQVLGSVCADQVLALGAPRGLAELSGRHGGKGRKWRAAKCRVTKGMAWGEGLRAGHGLHGSQEGCPPPTDGAGSRTQGWLPAGRPAGLCRNPRSRSEGQGGTCVTDHHQLRGFKQHRLLPRSSESGEQAWGQQQLRVRRAGLGPAAALALTWTLSQRKGMSVPWAAGISSGVFKDLID